MSAPTIRTGPSQATAGEPLPIRVRYADGTVADRPLSPIEHQALQLQMLHGDSPGYIELTPGTRSVTGGLAVDRRHHHRHFLGGPHKRSSDWLERLLGHSARIAATRCASPHASLMPTIRSI